jgi:hypothetical protein
MKTTLSILFLLSIMLCNAQIITYKTDTILIYRDTITNICQARIKSKGVCYTNVVYDNKVKWSSDVKCNYGTPLTFDYSAGCYVVIKNKKITIKIYVL